MMRRTIPCLLAGLLAGLIASSGVARADSSLTSHKPFLKQYCFECHGPKKQEGDHRFDTLGTDLTDLQTLETWQGILDQLNLGEMPPKKKPQPSSKEAARVIETVTPALQRAYAARKSTGGQAVIRRLNKFELRNTLRDLFYINHPDFDPTVVSGLYDFNGNGITAHKTIEPTRSFQDDEEAEGFDNIGQHLVMSDFLLKMLIGAAEETVEMATFTGPEKAFEAETFTSPICTKSLFGDSLGKYQRANGDPYDEVFQRWDRYNRIGPDKYHGGIRRPAFYRITVELSAHNPQAGVWGNWTVREGNLIHQGRTSPAEPFEVGLYLQRFEHQRGERHQRITNWTLPSDGKKRTFSFETWIDDPWSTWIGWENGPWIQHNAFHILLEQWYPDEYAKIDRKQKGFKKQVAEALFKKGYLGPTLRVHSFRIEPVPRQWPPKSHTALYGNGPIEDADQKKLFHAFAERAYRRPVEPEEVETFVALAERLEADGSSRQDAMKGAYAAMLCSPDFVYLRQESGKLDDFALASRLSYFLWSSMPDEPLMKLARAGKLSETAELQRQVERMLKDPKAAAFVRHFPERWLKLYELGRMAPDKKGPYGQYFRLKADLIPQVAVFFGDVLERNAPISEFIDSDYTFMNNRLGELIDKQKVVGENLRKVALDDQRRGGLLTMPAVMTVTANGVDTSPIVRGVYVLENILGTPPPPPPPDVEPLSPDLRGVKTFKEQFAIHRNQDACRSCHRKIDPLGFALESFDPIGRWRDHYPKANKNDKQAPPIDTTAIMADGREVKDMVEFKAILMEREPQVVRCLTEKMLTYATGRLLEAGDRGEVDRIGAELKKSGNRLRDLVQLVVQSDIFLNR
jgi:mono/diheme cytochrome c family protein